MDIHQPKDMDKHKVSPLSIMNFVSDELNYIKYMKWYHIVCCYFFLSVKNGTKDVKKIRYTTVSTQVLIIIEKTVKVDKEKDCYTNAQCRGNKANQ